MHGRFGEDGYIQTILENEKIKYTHSGVIASSIAMDKEISKKIFLKNKILTPKYIKYDFEHNLLSKKKLISIVGNKLRLYNHVSKKKNSTIFRPGSRSSSLGQS